MGLVAYVLWQLRDRVRPGVLFALYLVIAGAERFLIEFIRRNDDVALGLTAAQLESLSLFVDRRRLARRGRSARRPAARRRAGPARALRGTGDLNQEPAGAAGASGCGARVGGRRRRRIGLRRRVGRRCRGGIGLRRWVAGGAGAGVGAAAWRRAAGGAWRRRAAAWASSAARASRRGRGRRAAAWRRPAASGCPAALSAGGAVSAGADGGRGRARSRAPTASRRPGRRACRRRPGWRACRPSRARCRRAVVVGARRVGVGGTARTGPGRLAADVCTGVSAAGAGDVGRRRGGNRRRRA